LALVAIIGDQQADLLEAGAGSSRLAMRSRAVSLPARCCFSIRRVRRRAQAFFEALQLIDQVVHVRGCGDGGGVCATMLFLYRPPYLHRRASGSPKSVESDEK